MTTWKEKILKAMSHYGETWTDVVSCTLLPDRLDAGYFFGFGDSPGDDFTLWTTKRVYFPTDYDGASNVASVSRRPDGVPTLQVGCSNDTTG